MRGANRGEDWSDLRINDIIVAQSRATRGTARDIEVHGWEREIMGWALEIEGRMVTGEMAFMAARLFALESRRQVNRVSERLDAAEQTIREMRELVTEHEAEIGSLNTRVSSLENRLRRRGRRVVIQGRSSSGGSTRPPTSSSGTSSYGSRPLEGFVGTGSEEDPMTFVSVDRIEDLDDFTPAIPIPPPRRSLEERLGPEVGLQARLDANYRDYLEDGGNPDGTESDQDVYWSRVLNQRGARPVPEYPAPPSYRRYSPSH